MLHDLGQIAERGEQAEGGGGLVGRLERQHALAHRHQPLERMLDADRQFDDDDAEAVAELGISRLAQVDRRQRPAFDPLGPVALVREIAAHRAGDAGEQHVVDRAAERAAQRLAPGDALRAGRLALEAGRFAMRSQLMALCFEAFALIFVPSSPTWPSFMAELRKPRLFAQLQNLREQSGKRLQMALAEVQTPTLAEEHLALSPLICQGQVSLLRFPPWRALLDEDEHYVFAVPL